MYESKMKTPETDRLYEAIMSLSSLDECYRFFDDLCTYSEIQSMTQRLQVAELLSQGKTFNKISEETGVSTATITRVNKALCYGSGGYREVIDKQNKE